MHGGKPWMASFDNTFIQAAGRAIETGLRACTDLHARRWIDSGGGDFPGRAGAAVGAVRRRTAGRERACAEREARRAATSTTASSRRQSSTRKSESCDGCRSATYVRDVRLQPDERRTGTVGRVPVLDLVAQRSNGSTDRSRRRPTIRFATTSGRRFRLRPRRAGETRHTRRSSGSRPSHRIRCSAHRAARLVAAVARSGPYQDQRLHALLAGAERFRRQPCSPPSSVARYGRRDAARVLAAPRGGERASPAVVRRGALRPSDRP